jgi:hypothetical protein
MVITLLHKVRKNNLWANSVKQKIFGFVSNTVRRLKTNNRLGENICKTKSIAMQTIQRTLKSQQYKTNNPGGHIV